MVKFSKRSKKPKKKSVIKQKKPVAKIRPGVAEAKRIAQKIIRKSAKEALLKLYKKLGGLDEKLIESHKPFLDKLMQKRVKIHSIEIALHFSLNEIEEFDKNKREHIFDVFYWETLQPVAGKINARLKFDARVLLHEISLILGDKKKAIKLMELFNEKCAKIEHEVINFVQIS